ncbi:TetR/AcrR family transcriptional regulator [Diaphorobacter aerolatus]|uniref:TetR/AcrR family transcriptional regulator n=1 Tax=Diaphorobacter aerolatus TaxID=1288495 RepID=A0A7H0GH44_9BURK|nr:TetR/AcrR family transcriptional regulator [Diaphorobacter aerolatus]QNP47610.1 TetR/AcrR family transcriptional regulator [Diaphorobacter aerolatus]
MPAQISTVAHRNVPPGKSPDLREHILATASDLFYRRGVRAVGVDLVTQEAGVAKTSLYRHFPTKDDLIVAFLQREDMDFWSFWDFVAQTHADDPMAELEAHMRWIGERLSRSNYRGCPQINVAAEFADPDHPARHVSRAHMQLLRERLDAIARRLNVRSPRELGAQLALLVNGAFVSSDMLAPDEATNVLLASAHALCTQAGLESPRLF